MYCKWCGLEVDNDVKFCPTCGYEVKRIEEIDNELQPTIVDSNGSNKKRKKMDANQYAHYLCIFSYFSCFNN